MLIHRREFLKKNARLAAAMGIAPLVAAAGREGAAAGERVPVGVIGAGGRGRALMEWALEHGSVDVVAVCDVDRKHLERASRTVRDRGGKPPRAVEDFRRLLDGKEVEAVIVATPHHWHAPIAARALRAGKHVYLEKPASHVFREGRYLVDAAKRSGRVFQHGTQMRSSDVTETAGEVLRSGLLGEIQSAKAWGVEPRSHHPAAVPDGPAPGWLDWDFWLGPAPSRRYNPHRHRRWNSFREYGNGEIGGDGIHDIDMARWGLGATTHPVRVIAHGSRVYVRGESDFPDNMVVTWEYAGGKSLIYENRNFAPYRMHGWDNGNIFYGTDGYMVFSRRGYFQTYLGAKEEKGPGKRGGAGNREHVHRFIDAVRGGKASAADAGAAHLSCGLVHLGEIAYRTGRAVRFDPEAEKVLGDDEARVLLGKTYRGGWSPGAA